MAPTRKRRILSSSDESEKESSQSVEQYEMGEQIFCSDDGEFYKAKILKIKKGRNNDISYTVHYHGWSKAYDETISHDMIDVRFRKFDPSPGALKKLNEEVGKANEKKQSPVKPNPGQPKEVKQSPIEEKVTPQAFDFPKQLASIWKSDFEEIQKNKLPKISARFTTEKVVNEYKKNIKIVAEGYGVPRNSTTMNLLTADAILELFDLSLRSMILYKKEWQTYDDLKQGMMAQGIHSFVPRQHYGFAHLIRFCIKSDEILGKFEMTPEDRIQIGANIQHFTDFLKSKVNEYYNIAEDYQ